MRKRLNDNDYLAYLTYERIRTRDSNCGFVKNCSLLSFILCFITLWTNEVTQLQAATRCCAEIANCWQLWLGIIMELFLSSNP